MDSLKDAITLLHRIEEVSKELGIKIKIGKITHDSRVHEFHSRHHRKAKKPTRIRSRDQERNQISV